MVSLDVDGAVGAVLAPLDALRRAWLVRLARWWPAPIGRRDLRVAVGGTLGVLLSLALALLAPLWLLAIGPLVVGVPHLLADVRYLVVRQGLARRRFFLLLVALPLAASWVVPGLGTGLLAVAGALLVARAPRGLRLAGAALMVGAAAVARAGGPVVDIVFAHAHNAVGIGLWWWWRPGRARFQLAPIAVAAAGLALLLARGDVLAIHAGSLSPPAPGLDVETLASALSPVADPAWSLRLLVVYAFAQSVHYGVWLRLLPDDARPRPGLRSFRSSYRALVADCGRPLVLAALALTLGLAAWGLFDVEAARRNYLRMALFHGPLELCAIAFLMIEGRRGMGSAAPAGTR